MWLSGCFGTPIWCLGIRKVSALACGWDAPLSLFWTLLRHHGWAIARCVTCCFVGLSLASFELNRAECPQEKQIERFLPHPPPSFNYCDFKPCYKDKNIPSIFYVFTSQIALSSSPNGNSVVAIDFPFVSILLAKTRPHTNAYGKVALSHHNNRVLLFFLCVRARMCIFKNILGGAKHRNIRIQKMFSLSFRLA